MNKKAFQIIVDNTPGVLSRISGLFTRRGYNIESITAGETADPRFTRITIVASGDDETLEQIEKQIGKLTDVRDIRELKTDESVFRELAMIKVRAGAKDKTNLISIANVFRGNIIDVGPESLMIEITGSSSKIDAFLHLLDGYEILELARTGVAGLFRGIDKVVYPANLLGK
ncbi:MAG: acetolactate synthase small subunit [Lachnospiraceae bacterium]|nr:acetolactate synthase small subunit [Lachnospiraceae bacterium]